MMARNTNKEKEEKKKRKKKVRNFTSASLPPLSSSSRVPVPFAVPPSSSAALLGRGSSGVLLGTASGHRQLEQNVRPSIDVEQREKQLLL
jgi:hypothetical protein